ncbi:MAG: DUF4339 domain-containing protein [Treponema sp.]|jgi:hypothetical protein|nr:DUF4339 domain-containing protein [Treponema sp.]
MKFSNSLPIYHVAYSEDDQKNYLNIYDLLKLKIQNKLTKETYVWKIGMSKWIKAGKVHDLKPLFANPVNVPEELENKYNLPD